jgi:hypothetical protein
MLKVAMRPRGTLQGLPMAANTEVFYPDWQASGTKEIQ